MNNDTLIPKIGVITDIRIDTPDVKTFRVNAPGGGIVALHRAVLIDPPVIKADDGVLHAGNAGQIFFMGNKPA